MMDRDYVTINTRHYAALVKAVAQRDAILRLIRKHYDSYIGIDRTTLEMMLAVLGEEDEE